MWTQEVFQKAIDYAAFAHIQQTVPGKPYSYVVHLANVSMEVMGAISSSNVENPDLALACAVLHDTIEDTGVTYEDLAVAFGVDVASGVLALTKNKKLEGSEKMLDSIARIKKMPREIGMVKLADRITNLQKPPAHWKSEKIAKYIEEAGVILKELAHCNDYLANRLEGKIKEYAKYLN
ncbi:MAG TPA: HD domain-containing protein [Candidatus Wallbacteria bacterium]|nr:HD domain-containing protein [Candidatus Wallbacteria bacterium]